MYDYFAQKTIDTAIGFQCSIDGKAQGHCIYPDTAAFEPDPESFSSSEGKAIKIAWKA